MIQTLELNTAPRTAPATMAVRRSARSPSFPASRRAATAAASPVKPAIFAEPAFSSLWDLNLLDRLSEPLTRYHE